MILLIKSTSVKNSHHLTLPSSQFLPPLGTCCSSICHHTFTFVCSWIPINGIVQYALFWSTYYFEIQACYKCISISFLLFVSIPLYKYTIICLFSCWWKFRLLLIRGYYELRCCECLCTSLYVSICFHFFWVST